MLSLNLVRDYFTSYCTLGRIVDMQTGRGWDTMERPWIPTSLSVGGVKGYSCVGLGEYRLERYSSDANPNGYALSNPALDVYVTEMSVPPAKRGIARTRALIQAANWAGEIRGGAALGKERAKGPDGLWQVKYSRDALNELRNLLSRSVEVSLSITSGTNA